MNHLNHLAIGWLALFTATLPLGAAEGFKTRTIEGWTVHVSDKLLGERAEETEKALKLTQAQLAEIVRVVPANAVAKLREVPLWFSPEYSGTQPKAEYHPDVGWLRANKRDPAMAKSVEYSNVRILEREVIRMPMLALHELAHAYHDRVLGFNHAEIKAAYLRAKASGTYEKVERWFGSGRPNTFERAYAMSNEKEYFAETTEAFFGRNDFFPFTRAELEKHDPEMFALLGKVWNAPVKQAGKGPLKVFILAGQSNMEGHAKIETFDYIGDDPATAPLLKRMRGADGQPTVCDKVWISYFTGKYDGTANGEGIGKLTAGFGARDVADKANGKIGPEFTFGLTMDAALTEPVLIIKTAWGGRSLHTEFRPPSAGPYELSEWQKANYPKQEGHGIPKDFAKWKADKARETGVFYRYMIDHVKRVLADPKRVCPAYDAKAGYEIAGFVWLQGFNDMVDSHTYPEPKKADPTPRFAKYSEVLAHFIRDVRRDLGAPKLPFVIGVMGVGGAGAGRDVVAFREAMAAPAALPEFKGNVIAVPTAPFWSEELGAIDKKRAQVSQMSFYLNSKHKDYANADGKMTDEQKRAFLKDYEAKLISPAEAALWKRGASNAGYHYLGCAKTFALMGQAFAEANLAMLKAAAR
jgi:alpha-galactosidase